MSAAVPAAQFASTDNELLSGIQSELKAIRQQSEKQSNLISGASTYGIGYAIAFGLNMGVHDPNPVGAAFVSLLSWVNVGYCLTQYVGK